MTQKCIALLGQPDEPTDAVEEYCRYLGEALRVNGFDLQLVRVPWAEKGWSQALRELGKQAETWRDDWVLVQYTALAWSKRGFPLRFLRALKVLRAAGTRVGVVFHDVEPYQGNRGIDRIRRQAQLRVLREALRMSDLAVFTVPTEKLSWIRHSARNAVFVPVGANLSSPEKAWRERTRDSDRPPTIAIFGITGGKWGNAEMARITGALEYLTQKIGKVRVIVFGRHSEFFKDDFTALSKRIPVEARMLGLLTPEKVVESFASSDVLLFVRGAISSRRGSAIAGIACGLPVIATEGRETAPPITDAGVVLLSPNGTEREWGEALERIFTDRKYYDSLAERSRRAQEQHFSWQAIATRYAEALNKSE
jgi:glycosyltransferase involved in cell wall biosynthesis